MSVTKRALLEEIWKSKLSYCEILDPAHVHPDVTVTDLSEVTTPGLTIRLDGAPNGNGVFDPFDLYRSHLDDAGKIAFRLTARSHQRTPKQAVTNKLGALLLEMTESYGRKGNWRGYSYVEEMKSEALVNLCRNVLKYNESKSDNPHAYITRCMQTSFIRELRQQKKQASIRDVMLMDAGMSPSHGADDHLQ